MPQVQPQFKTEGGCLVMYHSEETGLPQVKDATVNDRDRMQDLLSSEKYLTTGYNISMNEASHDGLFQVLKQNMDDCHKAERQLFDLMFKKGWYKLPVADAQSVSYTYNQFKQYQGQLPFPAKSQGATASATTGATTGTTAATAKGSTVGASSGISGGTTAGATTGMPNATSGQSAMAGKGTSGSTRDAWLQQQVDQALHQAEQGKTPDTLSSSPQKH